MLKKDTKLGMLSLHFHNQLFVDQYFNTIVYRVFTRTRGILKLKKKAIKPDSGLIGTNINSLFTNINLPNKPKFKRVT